MAGNLGKSSKPLAHHGEQVRFEQRTTDPASTVEGETWIRTDLDGDSIDQIGTLRFDDGASIIDVPIFQTGTSETGVEEVLRLPIGGTTGYIPIAAPEDSAFEQLRMQHNASTYSFHNRVAPGSAIPDSVVHQYEPDSIVESAGTVDEWQDVISDAHITGSASFNESAINGYDAIETDGTDNKLGSNIETIDQPFVIATVVINDVRNGRMIDNKDVESGGRIIAGKREDDIGRNLFADESVRDNNWPQENEYIMVAVFDGSNSEQRVNGTNLVSSNPGSASLGGVNIGGSSGDEDDVICSEMWIAENADDVDEIESSLNDKYEVF